MNDADKKAFEAAFENYDQGSLANYDHVNYGFQAACEWRDSQVGEPVAWMVYLLDGESVCVTDNPNDFTENHRALPLYTTPPAAQINQQLTTLLEKSLHWLDDLCDAGPPGQQYPSDELTQFVDDIKAALAATQMKGDA